MPRKFAIAALATIIVLAGCSSGTASPAPPAEHPTATVAVSPTLAGQLRTAHGATAKYATDIAAAERDGYRIITPMMSGMGYHYLNPTIEGFDPARPPILVYVKDQGSAQLVAVEWVFPEQPAAPPLEGATYGSFDAACHFEDGTFVPTAAESDCPSLSVLGSAYTFWHPKLVTLHVWLLHNPAGLYHPTNPLVPEF